MAKSKATLEAEATEREEARGKLLQGFDLAPGDTVWTVLRHLSDSGMSRSISLLIPADNGHRIQQLDYWAARVLDLKIHQKRGGLIIGGAGMDMGFHLVYELSRALWPDGFKCIGEEPRPGVPGCPANDHHNSPYPARVKGSMWHADGGYALRQEWI